MVGTRVIAFKDSSARCTFDVIDTGFIKRPWFKGGTALAKYPPRLLVGASKMRLFAHLAFCLTP
jgi:hypothetical protein